MLKKVPCFTTIYLVSPPLPVCVWRGGGGGRVLVLGWQICISMMYEIAGYANKRCWTDSLCILACIYGAGYTLVHEY